MLDVSVLPVVRRGGDPKGFRGGSVLNPTAEKSIKRSYLAVRTGIRHR